MTTKPSIKDLEQRISVLEEESSRVKHAEKELKTERQKLGERIKELKCLYDLTELIDKPGISLDGILQGTADILPQGWQYPDIAHARIVWEGHQYTSRNFEEGKWQQTADIEADGRKTGVVEIFYLKEMPVADEGPFLNEEINLINTIAKRLGRIIQLKQTEETLKKSNALLKSVVESPKDVVIFALDLRYQYITFNENHYQTMKHIWGVDIAIGNNMLEYIKSPEDCLKAKNNFVGPCRVNLSRWSKNTGIQNSSAGIMRTFTTRYLMEMVMLRDSLYSLPILQSADWPPWKRND